jgi:uncharacterized membrane protein YsdA (DUF1294 family)
MRMNRKTTPVRNPARNRRAPRQDAGRATGTLIAAAAFLGFVSLAVFSGRLPFAVLAAYLGASVVAFLAYAVDKSAARNGEWRISERTLHLLGLGGGWPGALVARQLLRHKSSKASFRTVFWATVLVNCAVFAWFLSPAGAGMLREIPGMS